MILITILLFIIALTVAPEAMWFLAKGAFYIIVSLLVLVIMILIAVAISEGLK